MVPLFRTSGTLTLQGLVLTNGNITMGYCSVNNDYASECGGGAIHVDPTGTINLIDSIVKDNLASWGAGLYVYEGAANVVRTAFQSNSVSYCGGAIFMRDATVSITASTFDSNAAAYCAGGVYSHGDAVDIVSTTFLNNSAGVDGGGLEVYSGTCNVVDSSFRSNRANDDGGAIYVYFGTLIVEGTQFGGNMANYSKAYYGAGWDGTGHAVGYRTSEQSSGGAGGAYVQCAAECPNNTANGGCTPVDCEGCECYSCECGYPSASPSPKPSPDPTWLPSSFPTATAAVDEESSKITVGLSLEMDGLACADYGTAEEAIMNTALASHLDGVDESDFGDHECTDVSRRRALKTSQVSIYTEVSVDVTAYADDDISSAVSAMVATAVSSGALASSVATAASSAGITMSATVTGATCVDITTAGVGDVGSNENNSAGNGDLPVVMLVIFICIFACLGAAVGAGLYLKIFRTKGHLLDQRNSGVELANNHHQVVQVVAQHGAGGALPVKAEQLPITLGVTPQVVMTSVRTRAVLTEAGIPLERATAYSERVLREFPTHESLSVLAQCDLERLGVQVADARAIVETCKSIEQRQGRSGSHGGAVAL
jgi:hypothetical protein